MTITMEHKHDEKENLLFERVYVETPVDTDGDGKYDLIAVYIRRPASTLRGEKVPAIYVANPYMLSCNEDWYIPHDVNREVQVYPAQNITEEEIRYDFSQEPVYQAAEPRETRGYAETSVWEEDVELEGINPVYSYFNDRGYASVFCGGLGTRGSEGFTLTGSREEIMAFKSVIDWLCGRCRAFTNKTDNIEIKADWCTGKVAMSAKSYLGTMCIGVAATGVEGLETIIPEAGISNWYDYYRCNGLTLPALDWQGDDLDILAKYCFSRAKDPEDYEKIKEAYAAELDKLVQGEDRDSGNYNLFWDQRNYLNQIDNFKASVFIIHGLNDWNVKTNQCIPLFQALEKHGVERKLLLHQGEHVYVYALKDAGVLPMLERWLDHYLKGVDNGAETEPKVLVENNHDQSRWMTSDTWPPAGWTWEDFPISRSSGMAVITDDLSSTAYDKARDNQKEWLDQLVLAEDADAPYRCRFLWEPFSGGCGSRGSDNRGMSGMSGMSGIGSGCGIKGEDSAELRIAGSVKVTFDAVIDQRTAILSAMLADLGEDTRLTAEQVPAGDDGTFVFGTEAEPSGYKVISRGWLNAQNRSSLWSKEEIIPGQRLTYSFDMVPTDYSLKKGHKLALILYGIDAQQTLRPDTVTRIEIPLDSIRVQVPLLR